MMKHWLHVHHGHDRDRDRVHDLRGHYALFLGGPRNEQGSYWPFHSSF